MIVNINNLKSRTRSFVLKRGQRIRLNCGLPTGRVFKFHLDPGEFVIVTCDASPKVISVACRSFSNFKAFIHLRTHQSIIITC